MAAEEQERIRLPEEQERIYIPLEIVEEILVSLPVKSLLRFSMVSKSWNSLIFHSRFIKSHKWRGVSLQRRQQIPTTSSSCNSSRFLAINDDGGGCSLSPISVECISPTPPTPDTKIKLRSHCHELWCVKFKDTIFLWNPSMRTHRKIPNPAHIISPATAHYGLAYHSSTDDYNILYCDTTWDHDDLQSAELYSLRNNSWKKIHPNLPLQGSWYLRSFDSGFGALHFMLYPASWSDGRKPTIVCFDLSTEMYAEVAAPPYTPAPTSVDGAEVRVIREKLCVYVNYVMTSKFDLWVMQEYGDGKSWSKMFEIDCGRFVPYARIRGEGRRKKIVAMALHFDDDGRKIIVKVESRRDDESVIMEVEKDKERVIFRGSSKEHIFDFLYVETLISPATHGGGGGGGEGLLFGVE